MSNRYPIFIPTKGRYKYPFTINLFHWLNIPFTAFVEEQEYAQYREILAEDEIVVLPHRNRGVTVTRNYIWDYAVKLGVEKYWSFDDNIERIYYLNNNRKVYLLDDTFIRAIEDFSDRYENVLICGMNYDAFSPRRQKCDPVRFNTRVYSNMLLHTDMAFRFETFYHEDTDLCLRVLKAGYCTALVNVFVVDKTETMKLPGGNTEYYINGGRTKMVQELLERHPDVTKATYRFGKPHHYVDYTPFKTNRPIRKPIDRSQSSEKYNMILVKSETPISFSLKRSTKKKSND